MQILEEIRDDMKLNPRIVCLLIFFCFFVFIFSYMSSAAALETGKITKIASGAEQKYPVWAPDGKEILFVKEDGLYKIFSNGSRETKLVNSKGFVSYNKAYNFTSNYAWAPDGKKISYIEERFNEAGERTSGVWIMNPNGTKKTLLLPTVYGSLENYIYTWFPSKSKILYILSYDDMGGKYTTINSDGSSKQEIDWIDNVVNISLSPDGSKLACEYWQKSPNLVIVDLKQKSKTSLSNGHLFHQTQAWQAQTWTPDGTKILYTSEKNKTSDIYIINANGTQKRQLTSDKTDENCPVFSPDGKRILYVSDKTGNKEIWVMNADGKNKTQITNDPASDILPVWSPDSKKIAFLSDRKDKSDKTGKYRLYTLSLNESTTKASVVPVAPIAEFSVSPRSGKAQLEVQFTDRSKGNPTSWKWNFGDKTYSTQRNPVHKYTKAGKYTVSLTVKNSKGTDTETKSMYITAT